MKNCKVKVKIGDSKKNTSLVAPECRQLRYYRKKVDNCSNSALISELNTK